jgi:UDP-N-acetylmuramyl pentapeptide phosphotransferase/UDP-N-acetylglucosamine-1-phosphate transferase
MISFAAALLCTVVLMPPVIWLTRRWGIVDVPNRRSSHVKPVPRAGGLALAAGTVAGVVVADEWSSEVVAILGTAVVLGGLGLVDDVVGLSPRSRLMIELLTPAIVGLLLFSWEGPLAARVVISMICVAGWVNAFNFMDGINAISGLQTAVVSVTLAVIASQVSVDSIYFAALAICGASVGFLPFNAPSALIFLGDTGSYFAGAWLATTGLLLVNADASALVVTAPFLLYVFDTGSVLIKRAARGAPLMQAHREHTYQRLVQAGLSHLTVAVICSSFTAFCSGLMLLVMDQPIRVQGVAFFVCLMLMCLYLGLPAFIASRSSRATI